MPEMRFHQMADGRRIAFRFTAGKKPALVFLPGYMSDMAGSKASALFDWAEAHG
ncbi:MAG: alpha/beta hydrolase, partial [Novosphingobium sp.]|nr:alpha/beta hydrolase [Novosphingobium sp.]